MLFGRCARLLVIVVSVVSVAGAAEAPYYGTFTEAPPTSVQPQGWLREILDRQVAGLATHHAVSGYPFDTCLWAGHIPADKNPKSSAWWPYEQTGYLVDGLERLGLVTGNQVVLGEANSNVQYILNHPGADGSLGPADIGTIQWPHAVVFRALLAAYSAHPDPAIPAALQRHYLARPAGFGLDRDVCNIEEILWTYARTGDPRLLALARHVYDNFNHANPRTSLTNLASEKTIVEHGVTFNETAKIPALLYLYTGEKPLVDASVNAYEKIDRDHMLASGLHSAQEKLSGKSPWSYHETCDVSDYSWSLGYLLLATGDGRWADHIEKTIFNAGLGAITKDFKAHEYFSSPNQVIATHGICTVFNPDRLAYRPGHDVECCSGNVHRFLPNFALRQWLLMPGGGIAAAMYAPSQFTTIIDGMPVRIDEQTDYPFSESIRFVFHVPHAVTFPFCLRVPGWTVSPTLEINGQRFEKLSQPGSFTTIQRRFAEGDALDLHLPMPVTIHHWGTETASIERGPLVYSLKIQEQNTAVQGEKTSADFPAWDKRPASPWNYALAIKSDDQIKVKQKAVNGFPWDVGNSPIELSSPAKLVLNWRLGPKGRNPGFEHNPQFDGKTQMISLVPYGSTCLRLTVFPLAPTSP